MNELTRVLVIKISQSNKAAAVKNGRRFRELVENAWWDYMLDLHGVDLRARAQVIMKALRPEFFEPGDDNFIRNDVDRVYDLDRCLSWVACRALDRKIARDPELQLSYDWGDLPTLTAQPQLRLF